VRTRRAAITRHADDARFTWLPGGTVAAACSTMLMPAVSRFMTREPYTISASSTAGRARDVMYGHLIRHLPIMEGNELVGLVSAGELQALSGVPGVDLDHVEVASVMRKPLTVWGAMPLDEVAELMSRRKAECVVVLGGHGVQGIFTATDALRALSDLLQRAAS
jgi:CBS domain-containing protein